MAVVSKVPTEVLSEIFYLLCKKSIFVCELNNSCCKEGFPWAVGLVCRQWRTAFLSYPPIWASLTLSDSFYDSFRVAEPETRSEFYAIEINRRLALYLERSAGYPLILDIILWSNHNKPFTTIALEMLSACSHRWRTAVFNLFNDWQVDSILPCKGKLPTLERLEITVSVDGKHHWGIFEVAPRLTYADVGPWAKNYGWILPWTQLTSLLLALDRKSVIRDGDVPNLLLMLHNVEELRFRFLYGELDLEVPQFAPTPLSKLRVLEVPHPAILSWFETPLLCDLYFADYLQDDDDDEPLDVHGQISSLIQRSGCKIRKLSLSSRGLYIGTLKDVEELEIDYLHSFGVAHSSIDISSLPNLRFLTIICSIDKGIKPLLNCLTALKAASARPRNEDSTCTPISSLERVTVEWHHGRKQPKIPKILLEIADKCPLVVFRSHLSL